MPFDLIESGKRILGNLAQTPAVSRGLTRTIGTRPQITRNIEPQHAYMWEFVTRGIFGVNEDITLYAQRTAIPMQSQEPIRRRYAGVEYIYSGRDTSPRVFRLTMWDNQELEIYRFFYKWMRTMNTIDSNGKVTPNNYMFDVSLRLKDTTDGIITEEYFFKDCFPFEIGEAELDYSSSGVLTFDVSLAFNDMRVEGETFTDISGAINSARNITSALRSTDIINKASGLVRKFF